MINNPEPNYALTEDSTVHAICTMLTYFGNVFQGISTAESQYIRDLRRKVQRTRKINLNEIGFFMVRFAEEDEEKQARNWEVLEMTKLFPVAPVRKWCQTIGPIWYTDHKKYRDWEIDNTAGPSAVFLTKEKPEGTGN